MQEPVRAAALKKDRVMADGSRLMAMVDDLAPSSIAVDHQPSAMTDARDRPLAMTSVRDLMWRDAGLFRSREGLIEAVETLSRASASSSARTAEESRHRNLLTVARLIARAALRREESRGGHFRSDFPLRDDARWKVHVVEPGVALNTKDTTVTKQKTL